MGGGIVGVSRRVTVAIPVAGAKGHVKSRVMRLCVDSLGSSLPHPIGRLGKFDGVRLTPKRARRIAFLVSGRTLDFFGSDHRR